MTMHKLDCMHVDSSGDNMASLSSSLIVDFLFICCCFTGGEAAQCMPDSSNPCRAMCNGTTFDLSKAFDFPINITETKLRSDSLFWYMWSPCESYHCPGYLERPNCAVCQKADDLHWCCGQVSRPIFIWATNFPNFTIEYTFGSAWRITMFHFAIDHNVEEPIIEFVSEDPFLQYNFKVTGKCIGQLSPECNMFYAKREKLRKSNEDNIATSLL